MLSNKVYTALQRGILAHLWQLWMGQGAVDLFWACDFLDSGPFPGTPASSQRSGLGCKNPSEQGLRKATIHHL